MLYTVYRTHVNGPGILAINSHTFSITNCHVIFNDSFKLNGWISSVKDDKSSLLKYGVELLSFAIKEHKLELIDEVYKSCTFFIFLSIVK